MPKDKLPDPEDANFRFDGAWKDVPGKRHTAYTNRSSPFNCWVPAEGVAPDDQFFCHGHTFDTYRRFGYSPFSGDAVARIIADEYRAVPEGLAGLKQGDVVTWTVANNITHSCLVVNVGAAPN